MPLSTLETKAGGKGARVAVSYQFRKCPRWRCKVARVARADVPKAEEAETTVSAEQTVVARAADSVRDREEAVALQMLYSLRS